jgi:hypothetical protein
MGGVHFGTSQLKTCPAQADTPQGRKTGNKEGQTVSKTETALQAHVLDEERKKESANHRETVRNLNPCICTD